MSPQVYDKKEKKNSAAVQVQQKPFPGKALDASVFAEKFKAANEAGRTVKTIRRQGK
jgi:hypothetical protein